MTVQSDHSVTLVTQGVYPSRRAIPAQRTQQRILVSTLVASDSAMLLLAFALSYWVRFDVRLAVVPEVEPLPGFYAALVALLFPMWLGLFALFRLYNIRTLLGGTTEYARVFNACTIGVMVVVCFAFIKPEFTVARGWLVTGWVLSTFLVASARFWVRRIVYQLRQAGYFVAEAAIVGTNGEAAALAEQLRNSATSGMRVLGVVDTLAAGRDGGKVSLPILGPLAELEAIVHHYHIEKVVVATTALHRYELLDLFERTSALPDVELQLSSGLFEVLTTGVEVRTVGGLSLMSLNKLRLDPMELFLKTIVDYVLTVAGLILLSPLFAVVALLIKLDSPGPIFHRRRVLGVSGKEFAAFKFRTMYVNGAEILTQHPALLAELATTHKLKDDPRVTAMGRWMRKYSVDELPQLFNVLLGQMSLVGPRMIAPAEAENYGSLKLNLLTVKPGLTGLWQVSGRSDISYEDRVRLDMYYIRNYTFWQDLQILFVQTLPAVLKGRGAY